MASFFFSSLRSPSRDHFGQYVYPDYCISIYGDDYSYDYELGQCVPNCTIAFGPGKEEGERDMTKE